MSDQQDVVRWARTVELKEPLQFAQIALTVTITIPFIALSIWWLMRDRHRGPVGLLMSGGVTAVSAMILVVLWDSDFACGFQAWSSAEGP